MTENPDLLAYLGQPFETTELDGQLWLRADEIGQVMCLAEPEQDVNRVHQMNWQQFSDRLTAFVGVETREGPRLMRAFNLLGAYVLSTYFLSLDAQQFRRWLLETLIFHQIDVRREIQRLLALNAELEKRIAALEADMAQLKKALLENASNPRAAQEKDWLDGEFRRLHEQQQAHQADLIRSLSQVLQAAPPAPPATVIAPPAYPATRPLTQYGPVPVYHGEIGGKPCPVVSARDVAFFIGAEVSRDPVYHRLLMGDFIEEIGLREGIDFERMYYTGPIGTPIFNGLYYLSLDSAVAIARQRDDVVYEEWQRSRARQLAGYLLDCKARLADWENAQLEPQSAPSQISPHAVPDGPTVLYFGETPLQMIPLDGKAWFIAKEVCDVLGLGNPSKAIMVLGDDERKSLKNNSLTVSKGVINQQLNPNQDIAVIAYSGLSFLALRCNDALKPGTTAYDFRRWVTTEVLEAIFDTGLYEHPGHGRIVQPSPTAIPAAETPPNPSIAAKPEEPASEEPAKAASKPVTTRASKPKAQNAVKPANGRGRK